jgi:glycosyltransferase involved in cell wall biosynthesis
MISTVQSDFDGFFLVIPNYNGKSLLRRMLPSIDCPRDRILIVDIQSTDGSAAFAIENGCHVITLCRPNSYCQALNVGIRWALERNAAYIGLSHNDVLFATPVIGPLLEALKREKRLGIVAPTQIVAGRKPPYELANVVKYRSVWNLNSLEFKHDLSCPENQPCLVEADFCEFTTVVIPVAVFAEVGFLDGQFEFNYTDADFCFRAGLKGWRCAYLQTSQIIHYQDSAVLTEKSFDKSRYIASDRLIFHQKHSAPGVFFEEVSTEGTEFLSWPIASHYLFSALQKYGLIDKNGPKMVYDHPNKDDCEILFTVWETDNLPKYWVKRLSHYRHILVASDFNRRVFEKYHSSVHKIGQGVDPDVMNPWGSAYRFSDKKVFLSVFRQQYRKAFDVTVKAWIDSGIWRQNCELITYSPNLDSQIYMSTSGETLRNADFISIFDREYNIRYLRPNREFTFSEMSKIYRSADFFVLNSRSEGYGLPIVEAMGCGVPCIIPSYSSSEEFVTPHGCIPIDGRSVLADYSDRGFRDVGHWWEPDQTSLSNALKNAASLTETDRTSMGEIGRQHVLSKFTWRHSAFRFHQFSKQQLAASHRVDPPTRIAAKARSFWSRQFKRVDLFTHLLKHRRFGRALVLIGRFLQRRGY